MEKVSHKAVEQNSNLFREKINELVKRHNVKKIIETGTREGIGSTKIFAETGKSVVTCEANRKYYDSAIINLQNYKNVEAHHALSLTEDFISYNFKKILKSNGTLPLEKNFLKTQFEKAMSEVSHDESVLVFLDSIVEMGFFEMDIIFGWWMEHRPLKRGRIVLVMDDVHSMPNIAIPVAF